jgi:UDP-2,4-diacetamido-2,4,6-trideoxy-beta-L-altropyranose hydrolase
LETYPIFYFNPSGRARPTETSREEELWDAKNTLSIMGAPDSDPSWVVLDSYRLGHNWEKKVRATGRRIMVFDDFRDRKHCADLLVSDSETPFDRTLNDCSEDARFLFGRRFALVDPEYAFPTPGGRREGPRRLLVSYGGSDPTNETMKLIEALGSRPMSRDVRESISVDVVVGPLNGRGMEIQKAAGRLPNVVIHDGVPTLAELMYSTDLFLTAGGNSVVEALALRKPCLVTVTAENQALMVGQLMAEGLIRSLGPHQDVSCEDVASAIIDCLDDLTAFTCRVESRSTFDTLGAWRIATAMLTLKGETPTRESLIPT